MSNPEERGEKPLSKPQTQDNIPVQHGADQIEQPPAKGGGTIGIVSAIVVVIAIILVVMYVL